MKITDKQLKLLELAKDNNLNPSSAAKVYVNQTNRLDAFSFLRSNKYIISDPIEFGKFKLTDEGLEQLNNPNQDVLDKISFNAEKEVKKIYVILNNFSARLQKVESHLERLQNDKRS